MRSRSVASPATGAPSAAAGLPRRIRAHLQLARLDHWAKNVFLLPGTVVAASLDPGVVQTSLLGRLAIGFVCVSLVASSNYVLNEILDGRSDAEHPVKRSRPVPSGEVHVPLAYVQWIALAVAGIGLGFVISLPFAASLVALWTMGCLYNVPPVRLKDVPYVDVVSEAVNNPIRMLAGWYLTGTPAVPPTSLLLSYWLIGCYFMALKRFAEYREIADAGRSAAYRRSFAFYDERRLLVSVMFYGAQAMLFFGAFIVRYRLELILTFPFVSLVMAVYLSLAFDEHSAVQHPEGLHREPVLMAAVAVCAGLMILLLFVDLPVIYEMFAPTVVE